EDEEIIDYRDQSESRGDQRPHAGPSRGRRDDRREIDTTHRYGGRIEHRYAPPPRVEALSGQPHQESHEAAPDREGLRIQDVVEQLAEIVDESVIQPAPPEEEDLLHAVEAAGAPAHPDVQTDSGVDVEADLTIEPESELAAQGE